MEGYDKKKYKKELLNIQRELSTKGIPVIIIIEGFAASGKGVLTSRIMSEIDPRFAHVSLLSNILKERERYPFLYPYFKAIPENGKIEVMNSGYLEELTTNMVNKEITKKELKGMTDQINDFERTLRDNGYYIIKFFVDIDEDVQKKRLMALRKDFNTAWRVKKSDLIQNDNYEKWREEYFDIMKDTSSVFPWKVIKGNKKGELIKQTLDVLHKEANIAVSSERYEGEPFEKDFLFPEEAPSLDKADLKAYLDETFYKKELKREQKRLFTLGEIIHRKDIPVVLAFEGWDAAGKGGNIKRIAHSLDSRGYDIFPVASPEPHEKNRHFLWRFWNKIPRTGHISIFDRTWYGRVMVEKIEGFCSEKDWKRAYNEINEFEKQLTDSGVVVIKFWIHIDKDTQFERFTARQNTPEKQWKITDEDWRNREKWDDYYEAVSEMLEKTSTVNAPWFIIESNDKKYARIKTLRIINSCIEDAIDRVDRR